MSNQSSVRELIRMSSFLPATTTDSDRVMLCGAPEMLHDMRALLEARGFLEGSCSEPSHYVLEEAFIER
jgi:ferredoxin--NADP+ reductase